MDFESLLTPTLVWFIIGLVLLLLELVTPGLVVMFFGIGAWITTITCFFFEPSVDTQILIFLISSILAIVLLRKNLKKKFFKEGKSPVSLDDEFIGKTAIVEKDINKDTPGRVYFRGTSWNAVSDCVIEQGRAVEITSKDSITLIVKPKQEG